MYVCVYYIMCSVCVYIMYSVCIHIYSMYSMWCVHSFSIYTYIYIHTYTAFFSEKGEVTNQTANTPEGWGEGSNVF